MEVQTLLAVPMSVRFRLGWGLSLCVLLSLLAFASCGGGGDAPTTPSTTVPSDSQQIPTPQSSKKIGEATSDGEKAANHHAEKAAGHHRHRQEDETTISRPDHAKRVTQIEPDSAAKAADCPPSLNAQQCNELAVDAANGKHSPRESSKPSCPQAIDRSTCEEEVQKAEAQAESTPPRQTEVPLHCPEALSRSQCEELEAQLGQRSP